MRLLSPKKSLSFLFLLAGTLLLWAQFTVPKKPALLYPVFDETNTLTASEAQALNQKLIAFADSTSTEIEVVILPTTNGEDVNFAAWQIGEAWQIGKKGKDNGIVLLVAKEDRTISIQQGRDVEKYLTASTAGQIIDYLITPKFKEGKFYDGLNAGTTALMEAVQGKYKAEPQKQKPQKGENGWIILIIILIILFIFMRGGGGGTTLSRGGRRRYGGPFFFPFPTGGFGGGGFGGGGGGGGFGGFGGGGSFGGGGASGSW